MVHCTRGHHPPSWSIIFKISNSLWVVHSTCGCCPQPYYAFHFVWVIYSTRGRCPQLYYAFHFSWVVHNTRGRCTQPYYAFISIGSFIDLNHIMHFISVGSSTVHVAVALNHVGKIEFC